MRFEPLQQVMYSKWKLVDSDVFASQLGYFEPNFGHLFGDREFVPQRHPLCALVVCSLLEVLLIDDEVPSVRVAHRALRSPWRCSWTALRCDRLQQTSHQQQVHAFA